jgi:hypothetical protein
MITLSEFKKSTDGIFLDFDKVITLMETFNKVMDGHIFDQLYGFG